MPQTAPNARPHLPSQINLAERYTACIAYRAGPSLLIYLGAEKVLSKFLAPPGRLADFLAITGDKSDDIVGVNGYGPVKAARVRVTLCLT